MNNDQVRGALKRLQALDHPNLCQLVEVVEDEESWYLLTEHCDGGDVAELLDRMDDRAWLEEGTVAVYVRQVLEVMAYCHAHGIQHRDLCLRSLGLTSKLPDAAVKVSDFGFAAIFDPTNFNVRERPSPLTAPELMDNEAGMSKQADSWSIGALCYLLLIREMPYENAIDTEMSAFDLAHAMRGPLRFFREDGWGDRSSQSRDFIRRLLRSSPGERMSAAQALAHPWISMFNGREIPFQRSMAVGQENSEERASIRALALTLGALAIPCMLELPELERIRSAFLTHDTDQDGYVVRFEAVSAFVSFGLDENVAGNSLDRIDVLGRGIIDLCGFAVAYLLGKRFPANASDSELAMQMQAKIYEQCRSNFVLRNDLSQLCMRRQGQWFETHTGVQYTEVLAVLPEGRQMESVAFLQALSRGGGQGIPAAVGLSMGVEDEHDDISDDDLDDMPWTVRFQENLPALVNLPFVLCGTHCTSGGKRRDSSPHSLRIF